jgi:hypothetical protein
MTPRVRQYAEEIAAEHDLPAIALLSCHRSRVVWRARRKLFQRLKDDGFNSLQIGKWTGRDPSTVRAALTRHK